MLLNPYAPGAGTAPPVMVGRDLQVRLVDGAADLVEGGRRPSHIVLTGLRGVGKTVLLRECLRRLSARGWLCGYYEVRRDAEVGVALGTIVVEGAKLLPHRSRLARTMRSVRASIGSVELSGDPTGKVALRVDRQAEPATDAYLETLHLFQGLGEAAKYDGVGVGLFLDELQDFRRRDATTLLQALEAGRDEDSRVLLVGAGLPGTPVELAKARTYAERLRYEELDNLTPGEARRAVAEPAEALGARWDLEALDLVTGVADGYPYFLQLHASEAWEVADGALTITAEHVRAAIPRAQRRLERGLYATRYARASLGERRYLVSMAASLVGGRTRSSEVASDLGRSLAELSTTRDRLIRKGVVYSPGPGEVAFSVPGFADYVLRRAGELG
jgi:hypothetical protein